ncbi:hypothetical protein CHCC14809_2695 [Bacillus licheniformis]|nr:DUF4352 domain-containing protein [Bacillus licheniformis]TWM18101.1 hypothetical protein CHCC15087_1500 [Bacillus licheniformis]TWM84062.1 hypothetical protein CHCC14809_2695 [Bacillus licheniformis]TWM89208.1 hypothetical protein CHCC14596_1672 [Bacillus licheniformis]TWO11397.1 hypothetical protein CHCC14431_2173 [Bacillus licheniformis]
MMFASSGSSTQESKSSGSSAKTTAAKTSEEKSNDDAKEEKTEFGLNETADLDGTHITVTNVKKSMGNEYFKPKNGNEYVVVTLNIKIKAIKIFPITRSIFKFKMKMDKLRTIRLDHQMITTYLLEI